MKETVRERAQRVMSAYSVLYPERYSDDTDLKLDMGLDSLDAIEIVMDLEEEFGFDIDDDVVDGWKTFGDVVRFLEGKVNG